MNPDSPSWDDIIRGERALHFRYCSVSPVLNETSWCGRPSVIVVAVRDHHGLGRPFAMCASCLELNSWANRYNTMTPAEYEVMLVMTS